MAKANITEYSATAASNTEIDGTDISENCSPAGINNAIRELMAHLKDMDAGTTTLTAPKGTNITASTALKTPAIQFTDGDAAITIADGGGVTANNFSSTSVNIDGGAIDAVTLGTNSAVTQAVIDNININGTTIGHTSDTDLLTLTSGLLTVAGEVSMTTLDIAGTNVTATANELNILSGVTATATELNKMDGGATVGTTAVAGGDGIVTNDNGTMQQTSVDTFDTYFSGTTKTLTNKTLTSPVLNGSVSGTAVLDEDDFASNSATKLATQQSIKAYIDGEIITGGGGLSQIVGDTTPQLGGDLDVNGNAIVSVSNGNIALTPNGTGVVQIDGTTGVDISQGAISIKNGGSQSYVRFYCESSNAHYAQLTAPAHSDFSGNISIVLPTTAGTLALTSQLLTAGISSGNALVAASGLADNDFLRVDGTSIEGRSASELLSDIGATTEATAEANSVALAIALG